MNDYLHMKELYHHGIKGQKWGIRKEYEYAKKHSSERKESETKGTAVGALVGLGAGLGLAALLNKGRVFHNNGKKIVDINSGQSLKSVKFKAFKYATIATFMGAALGKKIMSQKARKKASEENIERMEWDDMSPSMKKEILRQQGGY